MQDNKNKIDTDDLEQVVGGVITAEQAYQAALKHAGKKKTQVRLKKRELDFDDGIQKYEIEFADGINEYEYDIDAATGMILKFEKDFND